MATDRAPTSCGHPPWFGTYRSCPHCEGDRNRIQVDELAAAIREAKATTGEDRKAALRRVKALGHPDFDGFKAWLEGS